jgi:DNA-binding response OmpR family regulator
MGDKTIKGLRERKENVRIIAMSPDFAGLQAEKYISTATELGVDALIEKPFEFTALVELFDQLMDTGKKSASDSDSETDPDSDNV